MERVYSGKSDKDGYDNMVTYSDGSHVYYNNDIGTSDQINIIFSRCWDSLGKEKQIEINKRIEKEGKEKNGKRQGKRTKAEA